MTCTTRVNEATAIPGTSHSRDTSGHLKHAKIKTCQISPSLKGESVLGSATMQQVPAVDRQRLVPGGSRDKWGRGRIANYIEPRGSQARVFQPFHHNHAALNNTNPEGRFLVAIEPGKSTQCSE